MSEVDIEAVHDGGLVEVGRSAQDPASLAMGFGGTLLRRRWHEADQPAERRLAGFELTFDNEDQVDPLDLAGPLYAVYRLNDPLLKARGQVLFAGAVRLVSGGETVVLHSIGQPDVAREP
jgi:hypothetical protein